MATRRTAIYHSANRATTTITITTTTTTVNKTTMDSNPTVITTITITTKGSRGLDLLRTLEQSVCIGRKDLY